MADGRTMDSVTQGGSVVVDEATTDAVVDIVGLLRCLRFLGTQRTRRFGLLFVWRQTAMMCRRIWWVLGCARLARTLLSL